ncbi:MAG: S41 family peptidase [Planctomycetota bacterium]|jgi:carboxyl-terminal processing protease|nr:S41 family peptidase [Planctomycetota bacterium]
MGKRFFFTFLSPVILVALYIGYNQSAYFQWGWSQESRLLSEIRSLILSHHVESVDEDKLLEGALRGMVDVLDEHSAYLDPKSFHELHVQTRGKFAGLGIEISIRDGILTVITPISGTPAHRAGILAGDQILEIDHEPTRGINLQQAVTRLRGAPQSPVQLKVKHRDDGSLETFQIIRELIQISSVKRSKLIDPEHKIGYIALIQFQEDSSRELKQAIEKLQKRGMKSLILDLRNNPGGLLEESVFISSLFLDKCVVVETRGRGPDNPKFFFSRDDDTLSPFPLILLINEQSASASEIVAGAIQDHRRGILVGERSHGKGSVQGIHRLSDGKRGIKLTTARYYTPSGRSIQKTRTHRGGLAPDIPVPLDTKQQKAYLEHLRQQVILKDQAPKPPSREIDPQLHKALDILRGQPPQSPISRPKTLPPEKTR